ncbi:conserved protein of unknown function [Bradyrhizobium sp. ORS 285]|nr:hypothetical protein [Bradyrhizobium sp. ORS 285]SMX60253.1 conserved protein of unknown function [Bradyrhizobium sp. ORS 285]
MNMTAPLQPTAIHAVPAELCDCGFRVLMIRQFNVGAVPPAFAIIDQRIMRMPQRLGRHGVSFAATFLPEVMSWLIEHLGRPSLHDETGRSYRNPRWPVVCWHDRERYWPSGAVTVEWSAEVAFQDHASWMAFRTHWSESLMGRNADPDTTIGEAEPRDLHDAEKEFSDAAFQRA